MFLRDSTWLIRSLWDIRANASEGISGNDKSQGNRIVVMCEKELATLVWYCSTRPYVIFHPVV